MSTQPHTFAAVKNRVLLAEDEPTNMAILSAYLRNAGYEVVEAENGSIAWNILQSDAHFDVLVTDKRMPEMDGLELATRTRNDVRLKNLPVIMQTSATHPDEILEGVRAGVYYYLAKPYEEEVLLGIMRSSIHDSLKQAQLEDRMTRQYEAMSTFVSGEMNIQTLEDVQNSALLLGSACARPDLAASGFYELLLNAVEHGNLGIGYEAKSKLLTEGKWEDEVMRRLTAGENNTKKVVVSFQRKNNKLDVVIRDEGPGFNWQPFMEIEPSRATQSNGRGIAKAALLSFDRVEFIGSGNTVKVTTAVRNG